MKNKKILRKLFDILPYILIALVFIGSFSLCHYLKPDINELPNKELYTHLVKIDGIGDTLSNRIVEYRNTHKPINIEDLDTVKGIGDKRLALITDKFRD